jgi:hypothetical protein
MARFAVVTIQNWNRQSDKECRGVGRQYIRAFKRWQYDRRLQILGTVQARQSGEDLGYIIELPSIFTYWDQLSPKKRNRKLEQYMRLLMKLDIKVICFPPFQNILPSEVVEMFGEASFILRDAYTLRIDTLTDCVKHLVRILRNELPNMEVGIWCADSEMGWLLTKILLPYVNNMMLGGYSSRELYSLADKIIKETGLACPVTTDLESCLRNKQFVVLTEPCDLALVGSASILVYAGPLDWEYLKGIKSGDRPIYVLSGWVKLPQDLVVDMKLSPWEELQVLDALLYISDESYKDMGILQGRISSQDESSSIVKINGFISVADGVSYDLFRMRYFS